MLYLLLKFVHLTAAACFIGGVFFEVMILSRAAGQLDEAPRAQLSRALGQHARQVMHWVVLALYGEEAAVAEMAGEAPQRWAAATAATTRSGRARNSIAASSTLASTATAMNADSPLM